MSDAAERMLEVGYAALTEQFAAAESVLHGLHRAIESDADLAQPLRQLDEVIAKAAGIERAVAASRDEWAAAGRTMTRELRAVLDRVEEVLVSVQKLVRSAETALSADAERVGEELERIRLGQQIHGAYGASRAPSDPFLPVSLEC